MATATLDQILDAIEQSIEAVDAGAKIFKSHILGYEDGGNIDVFREEAEPRRIRGYVIFLNRNTPKLPGGDKTSYVLAHAKKPYRLDCNYQIIIKHYRGYDLGTNDANSTISASNAYINLMIDLAKKPKLGFAEDGIHSHGNLQLVQDRSVSPANEDGVHLLYMQLDVLAYQHITPI